MNTKYHSQAYPEFTVPTLAYSGQEPYNIKTILQIKCRTLCVFICVGGGVSEHKTQYRQQIAGFFFRGKIPMEDHTGVLGGVGMGGFLRSCSGFHKGLSSSLKGCSCGGGPCSG